MSDTATTATEQPSSTLVKMQYRLESLGHAVRHRLKDETPDDVVAAAEKYYTFLTDKK